MSSALFHFFWTESDWTGTSSSTPSASRGSGGGRHKQRKYESVGDDFWLARERYLSRMTRVERFEPPTRTSKLAPATSTPPVPTVDMKALKFQQDMLLMQGRAAKSRAELQAIGSRVADLAIQIQAKAKADKQNLAYILALLV